MGHASSPRGLVTEAAPWARGRSSPETPPETGAGWILRKRIDGIEGLRGHLSWSFTELVQLAPGRLDARICRFTGPALHVEAGLASLPLRFTALTPTDRASVTFLLASQGAHRVHASTVPAGMALSWTPGAACPGVSPTGSRWLTVSAPISTVEDLLPAAEPAGAGSVPPRLARMPAHVRQGAATLLRELDAWGPPGSTPVESSPAERMQTQATELLTWALRACAPASAPSVHDLHAAEVVRIAERWLKLHLRADVYVRDLSLGLDVPGRTLEDSFRTILGVSPMRYLELLRAHTVLDALRSPAPDAPATVRAAEAQAGVRHPARFAARYRALFGENPAATLRSTRRGTAPTPVASITD